MRIQEFWRFPRIAVAAGAAAISGVLAYLALTYQPELVFPHAVIEQETVRTLVARRSMEREELLRVDDLQWVDWPKAALPGGVFTSIEALFGPDETDRRYVTRRIDQGMPILASDISAPGEAPPFPRDATGSGDRAVTIRVDCVAFSAGFLAVGDRVDILLTRSREGRLISSSILQDIEIGAMTECLVHESADPRQEQIATVFVTVRQARILATAQQLGRMSLVLRAYPPPPQESPESLPELWLPPEDFRYGGSRPFPPVLRRREVREVD